MKKYLYIRTILHNRKSKTFFDRFILVAAVMYPLSTIPQVMEVYKGNTGGISLLTWCGYVVFSSLFFTYGFIHRIKPMMLGNALWIVVNSLVIAGVIIHRI